MKKLFMIALMFFVSIVVNAQKTDRVFVELTKKMLVSKPVETVKYQNETASFWKIQNGAFYYITSKQEFHGKYKKCNFITTCNTTTFLGVNKKVEKKIKKDLMRDITSGREP